MLASLLVAGLVARLLKTRTALVGDIAMREQVELELSAAQTRFHRAFDEAPIGMALVDLDSRWRQVNRALCKMLRYTEAELLTRTRAQLTHPDDLAEDLAQVGGLVSGTIDHVEFEKRFIDSAGDVVGELGCGFALDDFGAGFGSFYYLKHLPFDLLKIDGEFVRHLGESVKDQLVVQSLARIATELGKQTVAEFVEDKQTLELVRSYGVDFAQGFGVGHPEPVSEWRMLEPTGSKAAISAS